MNATLADGTSVTTDIDDEVDGINGDYDVRYLNWNTIGGVTGIEDKFNLDDADESLVWLDKSELSYDHANLQVSNIDYEIFEYDTNDDGDVYSLIQRNTLYLDDVTINNGKGYINAPDGNDDIMIDNSTIFVNLDNNAVYTGYSEVPDIEHAYIAYVLADDANTGRVAEIVYIIDGTIYDTNNIFFVITDEDRETVEYDNDLYFEFENTYVDGRPYEDLYISYDALIHDADIRSLRGYDDDDYLDDNKSVSTEIWNKLAGKVIEVLDSDNGYATEIRVHYEWAAPIVADDSALDLSWALLDPETDNRNPVGYNTGDETTYVMIYEEYNSNSNPTSITGYDVDVCDVDDIIEWTDNAQLVDRHGRATLVNVVKDDDGEAQLVYVYNFDPDYHYRNVTVKVNGEEYDNGNNEVAFCTWRSFDVSTALSNFEDKMEEYGFDPAENEYDYSANGYEGSINATGVISILPGHDDLVIEITVDNPDIVKNDNLILDVTAQGDAAIEAHTIDMDNNTVNYSFVVDLGDVDPADVAQVTWDEVITHNSVVESGRDNHKNATEVSYSKEAGAYVVYSTLSGSWNSSDEIVVRITNAEVSKVPAPPVYAEAESKLASVTVNGTSMELAGAYADIEDAIANAVRIPLSTSANQEYTVVIETQPSDQPETDTYGDSAVFGSAQAAIDQFNPVSAPIDADGETYTGVLVGSYLIIYTENFGDEAYYAYYFG